MFVITLSDIIGLGIFALIIFGAFLYIIIYLIIEKYKELSKRYHDCTKCKHHYFRDTPDWYSCDLKLYSGTHSNCEVIWTKCKEFKQREED